MLANIFKDSVVVFVYTTVWVSLSCKLKNFNTLSLDSSYFLVDNSPFGPWPLPIEPYTNKSLYTSSNTHFRAGVVAPLSNPIGITFLPFSSLNLISTPKNIFL